jgi:type I site-specific restriction endonuclease
LTRKSRIDGRLEALDWKVLRYFDGIDLASLDKAAVEELPTASGPADYGLFVGGQLLAIVEAKKVTVNPQNVLNRQNVMRLAHTMELGTGTAYACLSFMRVTVKSSGTWMSEPGSLFLARSKDFIRAP